VAELASAFTCASLSIQPTVRHADYIGAWLEVLREDERAIFRRRASPARRPTICSGSRQPNWRSRDERPCRPEPKEVVERLEAIIRGMPRLTHDIFIAHRLGGISLRRSAAAPASTFGRSSATSPGP
jgi:hypothetical protein